MPIQDHKMAKSLIIIGNLTLRNYWTSSMQLTGTLLLVQNLKRWDYLWDFTGQHHTSSGTGYNF